MQAALDESLASGAYDAIDNGWILANTLTEQLRAINDDLHLLVSFSPIANGPPTPSPYTERQMPLGQCGFGDIEQPQPNVGYVKVFSFADPGPCRERAEAILRGLADFPVVIFDVTDAFGGSWGMSGLVLSHLLDSSNQISAMYWREPERIQNLQVSDPIETDAVLLADNPREKIEVLRRPLGVMIAGRWHVSEEIAAVLEQNRRNVAAQMQDVISAAAP